MHQIPVHPRPIPPIPKLPSLHHRQPDTIRPEQRQSHPRRIPHARVNHPIPALPAHCLPKRLPGRPIVGHKQRRIRPVSNLSTHRTDQFPVIRLPRRLSSRPHEPFEMPGRFRQRDREPVPAIPNPIRPIRKPARPLGRRMGKRAHHQRCGRARDPARHRHQPQITNRIENPRIGLRLSRNQQFPVPRRRDVLEQIHRRVNGANDPV